MKTKHVVLLFASILLACSDDGGNSGDGSAFTCSLGALSGTWRISYQETNGTCGNLPDETVNYDSPSAGNTNCKSSVSKLSDDKCRFDFEFACPTTDGKGTQQWSGVTKQTSATTTEADTTIQLSHPELGQCRSTYLVKGRKL